MRSLSLALLILVSGCRDIESSSRLSNDCPVISVKFSPNGGAEKAIISAINASTKTIYIQAFSFTAKNIAAALIDAKHRDVEVIVIADKETTGNPNAVISDLRENDIVV
jgi:phosphatidylserine/phosphatidylglycerophosphate/cardiolipin synthase-like enzyme